MHNLHRLGETRSSRQRDHLLQTPDTFVRTVLPGMRNAVAVVHMGPAAGAAFTQYTAELEAGGALGATPVQRFVYVLEGVADVSTATSFHTLTAGGYSFFPESVEHTVKASERTRLAVIEKPYEAVAGIAAPGVLVGREIDVPSVALMGDEDVQVQGLMPDEAGFDFAVNTMTYQPGAALSLVEIHVMEHGLLMLEGGGIYRLGERWYPVSAGDFIWMAPFCPQWFGALGKQPAKYLIYKDWNRHPIG
ncbi:MAG TPA: (S)-ureidoglycine aminohydrolase [Granulicella sp.]|nr:(S)-ureidoglycine aminohydrolase [Granulicella sp.]